MPLAWPVSRLWDRHVKMKREGKITDVDAIGFDFDFDAITSADSEWVRKYDSFNHQMFNPLFAMMPWLERNFLWLFPQRKRIHQDLTDFLDMLDKVSYSYHNEEAHNHIESRCTHMRYDNVDQIIENKRLAIAEGKINPSIKDNEKDLLTLMIESEEETGVLSNEELKVLPKNGTGPRLFIEAKTLHSSTHRVTFASFSWPDMTRLQTLWPMPPTTWQSIL